MKTINVKKLWIGKNDNDEFCLGLLVDEKIREVLINGKNISLSGESISPVLDGNIESILFNDYDEEYPRKFSFDPSNLRVSERLVSEWASIIKTDRIVNRAITHLADSESSGAYRQASQGLIKDELMYCLLSDYSRAVKAEQMANKVTGL